MVESFTLIFVRAVDVVAAYQTFVVTLKSVHVNVQNMVNIATQGIIMM